MIVKDLAGLIPAASILIGSIVGVKLKLSTTPRAVMLAVAAGLVSASVITDIVPTINESKQSHARELFVMLGIALGAAIMLVLRRVEPDKKVCDPGDKVCERTRKKEGFPLTLVVAIAVDMFVDGIVIGQGLHGKMSIGFIAAMTVEGLLVSSTIMNMVRDRGGAMKEYAMAFGIMAGSSLLGVFSGHWLGKKLGPVGKSGFMGAALSVVIWIVVMELMPEALEQNDSWWVPAIWLTGMAGGIGLDWAIG